MTPETFHTRLAKQVLTAANLADIADHYKTSTAFAEEVSIEIPSDEYDPTKLHVRTEKQVEQTHTAEKKALAHWAE